MVDIGFSGCRARRRGPSIRDGRRCDLCSHGRQTASVPSGKRKEHLKELSPLLQIRDLEVRFRHATADTIAVAGVDLEIREGEFFGLVGETGAGKSLTASAALRLLPPSAEVTNGEVLFRGRAMSKMTPAELRDVRGREIAIIVQNPRAALNPVISIGKQLANAYRAHNRT